MDPTNSIPNAGAAMLDEATRLAGQLPSPPKQPSPVVADQQPEQPGFLGSFGVAAINMAEGLKISAQKVDRFVHAIFDEILAFAHNTKTLISDVFSSIVRVETALGKNSLLDPMASFSRAWNVAAAPAQGPAEPAEGAAASPAPEAQVHESTATRYKAGLISKIEGVENKALKLKDIALKIIGEIGARIVALTNFISITITGLKEIGRVFHPQPLCSSELKPMFEQVSHLFKNMVAKPAAAGAQVPSPV